MANISMSDAELLKYAIENGIINAELVQKQIEMQKRTELLDKHSYKIWEGKNGKWYTYLPDENEGRILKKRSTRNDIENLVINFYKSADDEECKKIKNICLKELFPEWIWYKQMHTKSSSYIKRITIDWAAFYKTNVDFISKPIRQFTKIELDEWAHSMIKKYDMTKKKYYNMSIILRQNLEYAVAKGYIKDNVFSNVEINTKLFLKKKKKSGDTEVYLLDEIPKISNDMIRRFNDNPEDTAPLAVLLDFEIGVRIGELVAVKSTDIEGNYIHIQRQEIRTFEKISDYEMAFSGFDVVEYTKSDDGDRHIYLTRAARDIVSLILRTNLKYGSKCDDYIFVKGNEKINHYAVQSRILRGCESIGIKVKTMHKVRKTYISSLIDSGLNIDEIRRQAGHSDERTTYGNYCYNRMSDKQTEDIIEKALDFKKVIKGNQNILIQNCANTIKIEA